MTNEEVKEAMTLISSQQNNIIDILRIIYDRLQRDSEIIELLNNYDNNKSVLHKIMHK